MFVKQKHFVMPIPSFNRAVFQSCSVMLQPVCSPFFASNKYPFPIPGQDKRKQKSSSPRRPDVCPVHKTRSVVLNPPVEDALKKWGWGSSNGVNVRRDALLSRMVIAEVEVAAAVPLPSCFHRALRTFLLPPVSWTFTKRRVYLSLFMARPLLVCASYVSISICLSTASVAR